MEGRRRGGLVGCASRPDCFIVVVSMTLHHRCGRAMAVLWLPICTALGAWACAGAAQSPLGGGSLASWMLRWGVGGVWGAPVFRAASICSCQGQRGFVAPYALGL